VDEINSNPTQHHDLPRFHPWLRVMVSAFIPLLIAFFVPREAQIYLFVIAGLAMLAGLVLFVKEERAAKRNTQ
jgi:hypothetical protein